MRRIDYNQLPHQRKSSSSQKLNRHLEKKKEKEEERKKEKAKEGRAGENYVSLYS